MTRVQSSDTSVQGRRRPGIATSQRGAALITSLIFLTALGALAAAYSMNVQATLALNGVSGVRRSAFYAAEAGLNVGITSFANIFRNSSVPTGLDFSQTLAFDGKTAFIELNEAENCAPCPATRIPDGEVFGGLNTIPYRYVVQSTSNVPPGDSMAHVAGEFDIHNIPIFQFLAFIDSHLFVMPLPDMILHGRLHTNGDLYFQPDNNLVVEDLPPEMPNVQITAVGDVYRGGRKYDTTWRCTGKVTIDKLEDIVSPFDDLDPKVMACTNNDNPLPDSTIAQWNGSIKNKVRNIITPPVDIIDQGTGEYWTRADLRVVLNLNAARVSTNFGAADLCPGAYPNAAGLISPALYPIEVHDASGSLDAAKTRHLMRFLCQRRGALFYNDIPTNPPTPPNGNTSVATDPGRYVPAFGNSSRIYRRAGEDTSGDGVLNNMDSNLDTCPAGSGTSPWFRPPSCPWPYSSSTPVATSWFRDTDYRRGGFWNHRAQMWMMMLNVNLRALIEWNQVNGSPLFPYNDTTDGGLVLFFTVSGPDTTAELNNYAVRLFDSADLDMRNVTFPPTMADPTGVTIVSDQAILVQGNYNKRDKFPAAILADAIWILSQGWEVPVSGFPNDLKSMFNLSTGNRTVPTQDWPGGAGGRASFTTSDALTLNAALLFGIGPSTRDPNWYNGGLENFPKFLESWTNRYFNYRGSFVSLGLPQHKESNWACGSGNACMGTGVYDPPIRNYDYDADFNQIEKLPPMTPKVVYVQQRIYTRIYE